MARLGRAMKFQSQLDVALNSNGTAKIGKVQIDQST